MLKYLILFLFIPLYSTSQCLKANISILLDWSSSESGSEVDIAQSAYNFIHGMPIGDDQVKISLTTFSTDTSGTYHTFTDLSGDINKIDYGLYELSSYPADGGTILSDALKEGVHQIRSDGRTDAYNVIIIISDGEIQDDNYCIFLSEKYRKEIPNLSIFAVQIGSIEMQLPMAPLLSPQNPIRLHQQIQPTYLFSPISDIGYDLLGKLCGRFDRVSISSTYDLVRGLKKLDLCM